MRLKLRALSRFRPRILTLMVFFAAAAVIALANLSCDDDAVIGSKGVPHRSYGWPLIWHRIVHNGWLFTGSNQAVGWYWSLPRLAANVAMWLVLLAALSATCEWLLRRYYPRPRWSLRTLLAFVALVSVLCGWYAHARNRAALQDPLVGLRGGYGVPLVFVDRWGPKWLDILGMDRLRRRVVLASGWSLDSHEPANEQRFLQLARAPELRHLQCQVDELTPTTAKALGGMRKLETLEISVERLTADLSAALSDLSQLRTLSISWGRFGKGPETVNDNDARIVDECLAAIGNMPHLEALQLGDLPLHGKGLACVAGLKELKSLDVKFWNGNWKGSRLEAPVAEDSLRAIAMFTQLHWLRLDDAQVSKQSLASLAALTNLKTLVFSSLETHARPMLSHLPPLPRLESLDLRDTDVDDDDLRRLAMLPRLKSLSLGSLFSQKQTLFTASGLEMLASLGSLEEVQLGCELSPEIIASLGKFRCLKRLHLGDTPYGPDAVDVIELTHDDGTRLHADGLDGLRRSFAALRQLKPGLIIDKEVSDRSWRRFDPWYLKVDAYPERPATWLPGGDLTWMTPQQLADFEQSGGRASFYGATYPGGPGQEPITAEF